MQEKWNRWYQKHQKYVKWASIGVAIVLLIVIITMIFNNKGKLLKDEQGHYYRELKQGNRTIHVPVFEDKKLNEEVQKFQKNILQNSKVEQLEYELKPVGDLTQVIWIKKENKKEEKDTWIYHQKEKHAMTLKEVFKNWNQNTEEQVNHDGTLLNNLNIDINELYSKISFDIIIELNSGVKYKSNIVLDVPAGNILEEGICRQEQTNLEKIVFKRI